MDRIEPPFVLKATSSEVLHFIGAIHIFTGLRTQLVQWKNSDYLLFQIQVHQPKSVEASTVLASCT